MRRAWQPNDEAIARWLKAEDPAIAKEAKRERAAIYRGDEISLRSGHISGTGFSRLGKTPVV